MKPSDYLAKGFCKHATAKSRGDGVVLPTSMRAERWCMIGAVHAAFQRTPERISAFFDAAVKEVGSIAAWNDDPLRTQDDVVSLAKKIETLLGV